MSSEEQGPGGAGAEKLLDPDKKKERERKGKANGRDAAAVEDKYVSVGPTTWMGQSTVRCPTSGRP